MNQGLKRLSKALAKSERNHLFVYQIFLDRSEFFVFYGGTVAAGIFLNDKKFGILYGNYIYTYLAYNFSKFFII